jgi:uncharacterized protein (DUF433 family)
MATKRTTQSDRLKRIEDRLVRLEGMLRREDTRALRENAVEPWRFLVRRQHPWRKQLYLKGRNLTARQLVGSMKANQMNDAQAAANYHLPIEAIREALAYVEQNSNLLQAEAEIERLMHQREGSARVPECVS